MSETTSITTSSLIVGDNMEVLPWLGATMGEQFKCVYLDPPYNDGSQVFYESVVDSQTWLSELAPRLEAIKKCLRSDGVVAVSISDYEYPHLRLLLENIFGRSNLVCNFVWLTRKGAQGIPRKTMVMTNHEYIMVFAKDISQFSFKGKERTTNGFVNPDNDHRGLWKRQYLQRFGRGFPVRTITNPDNGMTFTFETPYTDEKLARWVKEERIIFPNNSKQYPMKKEFYNEYRQQEQLTSFLGLYPTKANTEKLNALFDGVKIFPYSKPVSLMVDLLSYICEAGDWVLDPYAGSGTTAHAVLELSTLEERERYNYVLIQDETRFPQASGAYQAGYHSIPEMIMERVKRVKSKLKLAGNHTTKSFRFKNQNLYLHDVSK